MTNRRRIPTPCSAGMLMAMALAHYVGAYYMMLERGVDLKTASGITAYYPAARSADAYRAPRHSHQIWLETSPSLYQKLLDGLFTPMYSIDRRVREPYWNG